MNAFHALMPLRLGERPPASPARDWKHASMDHAGITAELRCLALDIESVRAAREARRAECGGGLVRSAAATGAGAAISAAGNEAGNTLAACGAILFLSTALTRSMDSSGKARALGKLDEQLVELRTIESFAVVARLVAGRRHPENGQLRAGIRE